MKSSLAFLSLHTTLALALAQPWPRPGQEVFVAKPKHPEPQPLPKDLWQSLAFYSPYAPAASYLPPPQHCQITQANIIQRHGSRGPSDSTADDIKKALKKLKSAKHYKNPALKFLKRYKYHLVEEKLTKFGAAESYDAGDLAYQRYSHLVSNKYPPFIRATGIERCVDSAKNWSKGFSAASLGHIHTVHPFVISEEKEFNNTLNHHQCKLAGEPDAEVEAWLSVYAPTEEFNSWAPGADLDNQDILNLQHLCAFDIVKNPSRHHKDDFTSPSFAPTPMVNPFCALFNATAWAGYAYAGDLTKYYGTGYGQELGPVQGVGYINEMLARLTGDIKYVWNDHTQVNHTLDDSALSHTFPLSRAVYADFSHDHNLAAVFAAMGLFSSPQILDPLHPDPNRVWIASKLVPFAGRMVVEKMKCSTEGVVEEGEEFVRVLVNDAVMPLQNCKGVNEEGLCPLSAFVESQSYATGQGQKEWFKCFPEKDE